VYVGSNDGTVAALNLANGQRRWSRSVGAAVTRGVAVSGGVVYAGATGGLLKTFDAATGAPGWHVDNLGPGEVGTPMVADGLVFVASGLLNVGSSDRVTAFDSRDGTERWHFPGPGGEPVYNGAVGDGAIYISSGTGDVYRLDEFTGSLVPGWPFHADGPVGYLSGLVDGVLYVPSDDLVIHAVDVATAKERWRFSVQGSPNVPLIQDGRVFVGTSLGKVVAIGGTQTAPSSGP
jgi:outer membrane protein assembly factor BamB